MPRVLPEYKAMVRSRIIDAAKEAFREKGYRQTTMDEIARKLGISKAALYTYFRDKEELFKGAYEASPMALEGVIEEVLKKGDAKRMFELFFDELMPSSVRTSALSFEVLSEATRNPELRMTLKGQYDQYLDAVKACVMSATGMKKDSAKLSGTVLALWCGMETLVSLGYPMDEVRGYWMDAMTRLLR